MKEVSLKQSMNCSLSSVRPKWQWRNKGGRKSGGVRKANNYYADGGRDGWRRNALEESIANNKRAKEAARLTDLLTDSRRRDTTACPPARLPARGSLAKLPILPTKRRPRWVNATVLAAAAAAAEYNS